MTGRIRASRIGYLVVSALALGSPVSGQSGAVTIERLLSAPFPEDLVAAATGGTVAWVHNTRGVRNVWVAQPPEYRGRQLTKYTQDDGQEIGSLAFAPDGKTLFFVRGGSPNRRGEIPNPTSDVAGEEQAVWRVSLADGAVSKAGAGDEPAVSPKGDVVAFLRRGEIMKAPVTGAGEPASLAKVRVGVGGLSWSPDGSRLAFVSNRGDHSLLGVLELATRSVMWIDPSYEQDRSPTWSPDGSRLAFVRVPAAFDAMLFGPVRSARPWSIRVADCSTGKSVQIWRADEGRGSALHGIEGPTLLWAAGDRLVFPWEKDGWVHLYSLPVAGGQAALLTPGEGEVEYVALASDGREVLYNTNIGDIDRRHLFRVAAAGGAPVAVTTGSGIEWAPVPTGDGRALAFLRSDGRTPAHAAILAAGSATPRALAPDAIPVDFPARALVEPQQIIFSGSDGVPIHGQLFLPPGVRLGERRPALAFFHGGSRRQMLLGFHYMFYYHNAYALNQYFASRGYVVLSVNYRSGIGYGMEFREALRYGATGASEFNDVMGAGVYLRSRPDVDGARIGLWGGSYGGYLTAMGLAKASDLFAAGVDLHGVHDWNMGIRTFRPDYNPSSDAARLAFESSPMAWVDGWRSPVLLIHGDDDRNVDFGQSVMLVEALRKRGVEPEQLVFPDDVHDFLTYRNWMAAYGATVDFFQRKLQGR